MTTLALAKPKTKRRTYYGLAIADGSGSYNVFYRFTKRKTRGFKSFDSYDAAQIAFMIQSDLASLDLAPRVYGTIVRMTTAPYNGVRGKTGWGYVTEIAVPVAYGGVMYDWSKPGDNLTEYGKLVQDKTGELCQKIEEKTPYEFVDNHYGNVGWVKRKGKKILVCIDTGGEGFHGEDGERMYDPEPEDDDDCCDCSDCRGDC